jgi:hypothetical protein
MKTGSLNLLDPSGPVQACQGLRYQLAFTLCWDHVRLSVCLWRGVTDETDVYRSWVLWKLALNFCPYCPYFLDGFGAVRCIVPPLNSGQLYCRTHFSYGRKWNCVYACFEKPCACAVSSAQCNVQWDFLGLAGLLVNQPPDAAAKPRIFRRILSPSTCNVLSWYAVCLNGQAMFCG